MVRHGSIRRIFMKTAGGVIILVSMILYFGCAGPDRDVDIPSGIILGGCPPEESRDSIINPTAGFDGIVLTPGQDLIFQIDEQWPSKWLFWDNLVSKFPSASVKLRIKIDAKGEILERLELACETNPAAGDTIWEAARTWRFQPGGREGELCYIFNASQSEILIDRSRMKPVEGYEQCTLKWGRIHCIYKKNKKYEYKILYGNCE